MEAKAKEDAADRARVRRFAVSFDPLMLVVEVVRGRGSRRKAYLHRIKLRKLPEGAVRVPPCASSSPILPPRAPVL